MVLDGSGFSSYSVTNLSDCASPRTSYMGWEWMQGLEWFYGMCCDGKSWLHHGIHHTMIDYFALFFCPFFPQLVFRLEIGRCILSPRTLTMSSTGTPWSLPPQGKRCSIASSTKGETQDDRWDYYYYISGSNQKKCVCIVNPELRVSVSMSKHFKIKIL